MMLKSEAIGYLEETISLIDDKREEKNEPNKSVAEKILEQDIKKLKAALVVINDHRN